ncbi:MAG: ATP-binding cassette domain-containing protein, partial [Verrucomicrobiota bacterium]|nr:ATP-binding cassette domain-containing protein [Verrucomicrobiota bacterium]
YGEHVVYQNLNIEVEKKQRIVLVGPNGAGKSTLLKIIAEIIPIEAGTRELGHNVSVGYFSQQRVEVLNMERSILDEAMDCTSGTGEQSVRSILGNFLFRGDEVFKKVKVLSGGEKSRLALVKLLLAPPNLLLLDEPTTHLDMPSIDTLVTALSEYTGTLIFVSHDVHFIRAIAESTLQIQAGEVTHYAGNYDYYLRKSGAESEQSGLIAGLKNARPDGAPTAHVKHQSMSAKERRRIAAEERKSAGKARKQAESRVAKVEAEILKLETEQTELSKQLQDPSAYTGTKAAKDLNIKAARIAKYLEEKNYEWNLAADELSKLN